MNLTAGILVHLKSNKLNEVTPTGAKMHTLTVHLFVSTFGRSAMLVSLCLSPETLLMPGSR